MKFESGHTPTKSDRVMAHFLLRLWENKQCPDDYSWKDWWIQMMFGTCVYNYEKNVKLESGHTPQHFYTVISPSLLRIWENDNSGWQLMKGLMDPNNVLHVWCIHSKTNFPWLLCSYDIVINTVWPIAFIESNHFQCW